MEIIFKSLLLLSPDSGFKLYWFQLLIYDRVTLKWNENTCICIYKSVAGQGLKRKCGDNDFWIKKFSFSIKQN